MYFLKIKPGGGGLGVEYGGVRVQGMCPHEFYLGTCTCIFLKIKPGCGQFSLKFTMTTITHDGTLFLKI